MTYAAFEDSVHRYQDRVYAYACRTLGDPEAAADVTQDVLIRLWRHRDTLEEDRLLGWLLRVTRNACIDALRKQQAQRRVWQADADAIDRAPSTTPSPSAAAEAADLRVEVQRALDRLREPYRSLVILRDVEGLSYEDLCGALDLPLTTVKVYLHRARKQLRAHLRDTIHREHA